MTVEKEGLDALERSLRRVLKTNILSNPKAKNISRLKFDLRAYEKTLTLYPDESIEIFDRVIGEFEKPSNKEAAKLFHKAIRTGIDKLRSKKDLATIQNELDENDKELREVKAALASIDELHTYLKKYILDFVVNIDKDPQATFKPALHEWSSRLGGDETVAIATMFNVLTELKNSVHTKNQKAIFDTIKAVQWKSVESMVVQKTGKPMLTLKDYEDYLNWIYFERKGEVISEDEYNEGMNRFAFLVMAEADEAQAIHERLARRWEKKGPDGKKKADELRKIYQDRMKEVYNIHIFGRKKPFAKEVATPDATVEELSAFYSRLVKGSTVPASNDFKRFMHLFPEKEDETTPATELTVQFFMELENARDVRLDAIYDAFFRSSVLPKETAIKELRRYLKANPSVTLAGVEQLVKRYMRLFNTYPDEAAVILGDWFVEQGFADHMSHEPHVSARNIITMWTTPKPEKTSAEFRAWLDNYTKRIDERVGGGKVNVSSVWNFREYVLLNEKAACTVMSDWIKSIRTKVRSDEAHDTLMEIARWVDAVIGVIDVTPENMREYLTLYFAARRTNDMKRAGHLYGSIFMKFLDAQYEALEAAFREDPSLGSDVPGAKKQLLNHARDLNRKINAEAAELTRQHLERRKELNWFAGEGIVLQKNDASRLHVVIEYFEKLSEDKRATETPEEHAALNTVLDALDQSQVFVVKHNWGDVFKEALQDVGKNYNLPYPHCVFEFMISGKPVVLYVTQPLPDSPVGFCAFTSLTNREHLNSWAMFPESEWIDHVFPENPEQETPFMMAKRQVIAICVALNSTAATTEVTHQPVKVNEKRIINGKPIMKDFHVVDLSRRVHARVVGRPRSEYQGIIRAHLRRRHDRHYANGEVVTIDWMIVGNPDLGFVDHFYKL